jgi:hypothetical protein
MKFGCAVSHDLGNYLDQCEREDKEAEAFAEFVQENWGDYIGEAIIRADEDNMLGNFLWSNGDAEKLKTEIIYQLFQLAEADFKKSIRGN